MKNLGGQLRSGFLNMFEKPKSLADMLTVNPFRV